MCIKQGDISRASPSACRARNIASIHPVQMLMMSLRTVNPFTEVEKTLARFLLVSQRNMMLFAELLNSKPSLFDEWIKFVPFDVWKIRVLLISLTRKQEEQILHRGGNGGIAIQEVKPRHTRFNGACKPVNDFGDIRNLSRIMIIIREDAFHLVSTLQRTTEVANQDVHNLIVRTTKNNVFSNKQK